MTAGPGRQSGAALLLALLAVVLASVLALGMIERSQQGLARTQALLDGERAVQLAHGMALLAQDWLASQDIDDPASALLEGQWSAPFSVPGGVIQGRLLDQNARFNLNALAHPDPIEALEARLQFERLLELLGLEPRIAVELADWLDGGAQPRPGGAGDAFYAGRQPPYRQAGTLMAHASELRWLRSVDSEVYQRLLPHVTALPEPVRLFNVQTMDEWVMASLWVDLSVAEARRIRLEGPYPSVEQFLAHPLLANRPDAIQAALLTRHSRWFLAQARVTANGLERDYFRLMLRGASGYDFRWFSQGTH